MTPTHKRHRARRRAKAASTAWRKRRESLNMSMLQHSYERLPGTEYLDRAMIRVRTFVSKEAAPKTPDRRTWFASYLYQLPAGEAKVFIPVKNEQDECSDPPAVYTKGCAGSCTLRALIGALIAEVED